MTVRELNEAIREITEIIGKWQYGASNKRDKALRLGKEALERIRANRQFGATSSRIPLPGETKE